MNPDTELHSQYEIPAFSTETLGLMKGDPPAAFDSLTRVAMRMFGVPVALVSIVQEEQDRQFFLSHQGLSEPWRSLRQTPLSHSFCQYVKREGKPLVVNDARAHPLVKDNKAIDELGVIAYLGVPIFLPDGSPIGALCVIEGEVRNWTDEDLSGLNDLANCVNDEFLLRATLIMNERAHLRAQRYSAMRESIAMAFMAPDLSMHQRFQELLRASCMVLGMKSARISKIDCGQAEPLFEHDTGGYLAVRKSRMNLESLTKLVAAECRHIHLEDLSNAKSRVQYNDVEHGQGSYAGSPLILGGTLYGVIEFFSDEAQAQPWSEEAISILSIISMLATAQLGVFGQIETLQKSEGALIQYLSEARNPPSAL